MNASNRSSPSHYYCSPLFSPTISSISRDPCLFRRYSPPLVHLHPQTLGHYFKNLKSRVELVDGYLIKQKIINGTHRAITLKIIYFLSKAAAALDKKLYIDTETDVFIPSRQKALEQLLEVVKSTQSPNVSSSSSSSSSPARSKSSKNTNSSSNSTPSPSSKKSNYRPDISVYDVNPQEMKNGKLKSTKPPIMVFEITSDNRANDLTNKWTNYRRANIPEYVILDRDQTHEQSSDYSPSVIVGKLGKSWSLAPSGNPTVSARSNCNVSHHSEHQMYPREVYKVDDARVVDCSFIKMTAREMLTPTPVAKYIMKDLEEARKREERIRKIEEETRKIKERTRNYEEEARKREEEARKKGEEEGRKRVKEEARKREEEARKRGEEEGRKRVKEESRKRVESLKKEIDLYKRKLDMYKRERDEQPEKQEASEAKPNEPLVNKSTANSQVMPRKKKRRNSTNSYNSDISLTVKSLNGSVEDNKTG